MGPRSVGVSRRVALVVSLVGASVLVAGCGAPPANPLDLPSLGASPDPAGSAGGGTAGSRAGGAGVTSSTRSGSGAARAERAAEAAAEGATARLGEIDGSARGREDLVRAVVDYMAVRVTIGNTWQVDEGALAGVADGRAAEAARARADTMRAKELRVVGSYVVNADAVRRSGERATVSGCMEDLTSEVDRIGQTLVGPPGGRRVTLTLRRVEGRWLVHDVPRDAPPFCSVGRS